MKKTLLKFRIVGFLNMPLIYFFSCIVAGRVDIWVCYRGYFNRFQDALPWMEISLLHS